MPGASTPMHVACRWLPRCAASRALLLLFVPIGSARQPLGLAVASEEACSALDTGEIPLSCRAGAARGDVSASAPDAAAPGDLPAGFASSDGGSGGVAAGYATVDSSWGGFASAPSSRAKADLITQELQALRGFVKTCRERIGLLHELRNLSEAGYDFSLPEAHSLILGKKLPLLSEIEVDQAAAATSSSDDFVVTKAIVRLESEVPIIVFLPLRSSRGAPVAGSSSNSLPSALLVAMQSNGMAQLFTPTGEQVLRFSTSHAHPVEHVIVSHVHDEYMITTGDAAGIVRVHKIGVRQRRHAKHKRQTSGTSAVEERNSQYLGLQVNATAQFIKQLAVPRYRSGTAPPNLTALATVSMHGSKYYALGDSIGRVNIFTKNGTLQATLAAAPVSEPPVSVDSLHANLGKILFRTRTTWGLIDIEHFTLKRLSCKHFKGAVVDVVFDAQISSRMLVADEAGTVWVFNMGEGRCKVEHRFAPGATKRGIELASIRGFALGLERSVDPPSATLLALNMTHVGKKKYELSRYPSPVVWRRRLAPVRTWTVHKRYMQGDLVAFLSEDGMEIEIDELLMEAYAQNDGDPLSNYKLHAVAFGILVVFGYHYMKNKSPE